jgi:hypothetical protein
METGVHTGESLKLASCRAIGLDPDPQVGNSGQATVYAQTSDSWFEDQTNVKRGELDFGFIDGMHLMEFALRDFMNMERLSSPRGFIVFDDVLPYNHDIARRTQPPGDWTGDVWKVWFILNEVRPDLDMRLVDTFPTGTLMVWNLDPDSVLLVQEYAEILKQWQEERDVPDEIIFRTSAITADQAIDTLRVWV